MTQRTQGEWKIVNRHRIEADGYGLIANLRGNDFDGVLDANARIIVRAVNFHAEMVEALQWALEQIEYAEKPRLIHTREDTERKIKSLLAKAGAA